MVRKSHRFEKQTLFLVYPDPESPPLVAGDDPAPAFPGMIPDRCSKNKIKTNYTKMYKPISKNLNHCSLHIKNYLILFNCFIQYWVSKIYNYL